MGGRDVQGKNKSDLENSRHFSFDSRRQKGGDGGNREARQAPHVSCRRHFFFLLIHLGGCVVKVKVNAIGSIFLYFSFPFCWATPLTSLLYSQALNWPSPTFILCLFDTLLELLQLPSQILILKNRITSLKFFVNNVVENLLHKRMSVSFGGEEGPGRPWHFLRQLDKCDLARDLRLRAFGGILIILRRRAEGLTGVNER